MARAHAFLVKLIISFRRHKLPSTSAPLFLAVVLLIQASLGDGIAAQLTFLRTHGHDIINERGETILLRGVGLGNWMLPEGYMWKFGRDGDRPRRIEKMVADMIGDEPSQHFWEAFRRNYITEADIRRIADLGFNSVRPALNARLFLTETGPPVRVEEGYRLLDDLVAWCRKHQLYVIIDMHGAPGGQTGQNIDDSLDDQPRLFMDTHYQDRLVDLWVSIANRYKNEPAVAGYDLLNEPLPERTGAAAKYKHLVEPLYQRITRAIREVDSRHMIILEGVDWANDWSIFTKPFDDNLVYQCHYYCWDTPAVVKNIDRYVRHRERLNAPVWVGETGERDGGIYWATTAYFEANNIGWSFWPWKKVDSANAPFSIRRPQHWSELVAYSQGGKRPSREVAQAALDELILNLRIENCDFFPGVVNSILRQTPARIEAENFGFGGAGVSYHVRDRSTKSAHYRPDQSVKVTAAKPEQRSSDVYVTLSETEWTSYSIHNRNKGTFDLIVRARAPFGAGVATLVRDGRSYPLRFESKDWTELNLGKAPFDSGLQSLKLEVKRGLLDFDWIDVR